MKTHGCITCGEIDGEVEPTETAYQLCKSCGAVAVVTFEQALDLLMDKVVIIENPEIEEKFEELNFD